MVRRAGLIILAVTLLYAISAEARMSIDAPHNISNGIDCESCHGASLLASTHWNLENPKPQDIGNIDRTLYNLLCMSCHTKKIGPFNETEGPYVVTHSSRETESTYHDGSWSKQCIDCHNPHIQEQKNWPGSYVGDPDEAVKSAADKAQLQLATGKIVGFFYDRITDTSILTFDLATGITYKNGWNPARLSAKTSEYARTIIFPNALNLRESYLVLNVDDEGQSPYNTITVKGNAAAVWRGLAPDTNFYIIYGQLIKQQVNGRDVKFFDNTGTNSFADGDAIHNGICEVCHALTVHYKSDGTGAGHTKLDRVETINTDGVNCVECHRHTVGFAHKLDGTGDKCGDCHNSNSHPEHLALNVKCSGCHNLDDMRNPDHSIKTPDNSVCLKCHQDGRGGPPNDTTYTDNWSNPSYDMKCDGCHNGRPDTFDSQDMVLWNSPDETYGEMQTFGHKRLIGETGVRQYPCWYCHVDTIKNFSDQFDAVAKIDTRWDNWIFTDNHVDGKIDVYMAEKWHIDGLPMPEYKPDSKNCLNTYCHSDGTGNTTDFRPYPWDDNTARGNCDSCHGHPTDMACYNPGLGCHPDDPEKAWTDETSWLSAMPMYENEGPGTSRANSHFRHLFSGFSCDDCHYNTVGGACLGCHEDGIPSSGNMTEQEAAHVNGLYHVNKLKNVDFKEGGTYYRTRQGEHEPKSCANTACHTGEDPVWGGSISRNVTCLECHGTSGPDLDDFGAFNGSQAKINLTEWVTAGHGRPELDINSDPNPYRSGKPAANFPTNGCWYCHDNNVLHKDNSNPFRLRKHNAFRGRFDMECAYCHMEETNADCIRCHYTTDSKTLAPQLGEIDTLIQPDHTGYDSQTSCRSVDCHPKAHEQVEDADCLHCHDNPALSAIPQLVDTLEVEVRVSHLAYNEFTSCDNPTDGCHVDNATRHKLEHPLNTEIKTRGEIIDVKNQYIMMGVCLICHEDDAGGQCQECHVPEADEPANKYDPGYDPGIPGLVRIQPKEAKASSFHFGYKHYQAYHESVAVDQYSGAAALDATKNNKVHGAPEPAWIDDQWKGFTAVMTSGLNTELTRKIESNTVDTITLSIPLPNLAMAGDTFVINSPVWKGGKFCWDCHDPHGDKNSFTTGESDKYNIFMIQTFIATETDGIFGKPIPEARRPVKFVRNQSGTDYARSQPPYNGVCNVCHDDAAGKTQHFNKSGGDGHNAARKCTICHEHQFTDSHAGNKNCNECHGQHVKPVPRHTAFGLPRDCTKCHDGTINNRMNVMGQLRANSHHIQRDDGPVNNKDCYACHWEATPDGLININYHTGYNYKAHTTVKDDRIDLVLWGPGRRPTIYDADGTITGTVTVTTFRATNLAINNSDPDIVLQTERAAVAQITPHCLSCHSDQNNESDPFNDCKTPRQYSWDGYSIEAKYSDMGTARWGKYTSPSNSSSGRNVWNKYNEIASVAEKNIVKAFSSHGNAVNNAGGFDEITGVDDAIPNTRGGTRFNVQCFDCHSSHGSYVSGVSSSYVTFNGTHNGANLKETQAGKGGYSITYKASAWPDPNAVNPYNVGAGQCFDCHETFTGSPKAGNTKPWGYARTYEASEPIIGYKDNERFSGSYKGILIGDYTESINYQPFIPANTYPNQTQDVLQKPTDLTVANVDLTYRQAQTTLGGHMNASHNNANSPNYNSADPSVNDVPVTNQINGLCTPCHDPHGVSPSLGSNKKYGVPLLKGTWLTSPYRDDHPPPKPYIERSQSDLDIARNPSFSTWPIYQNYWGWPRGAGGKSDVPRGQQNWVYYRDFRYNLDRNTFGDMFNNNALMTENDQQFAGLCLRCHPKENLTNPNVKNDMYDSDQFRTVERIHEAVKGWGGDANEHFFSCSKCHQPHASGLPRLMTTNCIDYNHRGGEISGFSPQNYSSRGFPSADFYAKRGGNSYATECHAKVDPLQNPATSWPDNQLWNNITTW